MARTRKLTKREFVRRERTRRKLLQRKAFPKIRSSKKTNWALINLPVLKELEKLLSE